MPAVNVPTDDEAGRITDPAIAVARGGFEAGLQAGTIAVTPVEDFAFVQEDRIVKPVPATSASNSAPSISGKRSASG
jgi:hypothetical protein